MSNIKDQVIITYGLDEDEIFELNKAFKGKISRECIVINEDMGKWKLKEILIGESEESEKMEFKNEKVVIFNNFPNHILASSVKKVRSSIESKPILATVTPVSINWSFEYLMNHLIEEREYYNNQNNKK